ncbi:hypothetical protein DPMN_147172 [Dreissena polymorpha]|uniref:Uncharacterized protein n=1 Tax=Dreissena polymorpha TaxID=45954 RepID=A0A9D4IZ33_DREPO|nr:hypothetical protein DPMN_147172 [Dreissena polymorpha]
MVNDYTNGKSDAVYVNVANVLVSCNVEIWIGCAVEMWTGCDEIEIFWNTVSMSDDVIAYERRDDYNCSTKKSVSDVHSLMKTMYSTTKRM